MMKKVFLCLLLCLASAFGLGEEANVEQVKFALAQEFKAQNPKIIIHNVELHTATLPKNFSAYEFIKLGEGNFVKCISWYDNEWGFSCQMLNTARRMFGLEVRPF